MSFREFVFIDYKSSHCDYRGVHIPQRMQAHKIPDDKPADSNRSQTKYHGADGKPWFSLYRSGHRGLRYTQNFIRTYGLWLCPRAKVCA